MVSTSTGRPLLRSRYVDEVKGEPGAVRSTSGVPGKRQLADTRPPNISALVEDRKAQPSASGNGNNLSNVAAQTAVDGS